jgi:hypothetical protein
MRGIQIFIVLPQWNKALDWHLSTPTHYTDSWADQSLLILLNTTYLREEAVNIYFIVFGLIWSGDQTHDVLHSRWTCCPLHHWGGYCGEKNLTQTYVPVMHGRFFPVSSLCHDISKMLLKMLNTSYSYTYYLCQLNKENAFCTFPIWF